MAADKPVEQLTEAEARAELAGLAARDRAGQPRLSHRATRPRSPMPTMTR